MDSTENGRGTGLDGDRPSGEESLSGILSGGLDNSWIVVIIQQSSKFGALSLEGIHRLSGIVPEMSSDGRMGSPHCPRVVPPGVRRTLGWGPDPAFLISEVSGIKFHSFIRIIEAGMDLSESRIEVIVVAVPWKIPTEEHTSGIRLHQLNVAFVLDLGFWSPGTQRGRIAPWSTRHPTTQSITRPVVAYGRCWYPHPSSR